MTAPQQTILEGLNQEQHNAVTHESGPLLIIAGAGTGKTTVVTRRIAYLIEQGLVQPHEILALTFTEKASGEMEDRVQALLPFGYVDLWISTFHAFGERILKDHALDIGLSNDFKLLTDTEQWLLMRERIDDFELDYYKPKGNPTKFVQALISHFSRLKDEDIMPAEYLAYAEQLQLDTDSEYVKKKKGLSDEDRARVDEARRTLEVARAYHRYQELLREKNAMDFGDLITETIHLFKERPALLQKYREQFKFILVDEFQDTNLAQYDLIKMLASPKNNLTVVADDDQSIYHFRGASMSNMLLFKKDFPESAQVALVENYRSTQNILDLAYACIQSNNPDRLEQTLHISKKLHSNTAPAGRIEHLHSQSLEGEAKLVLDTILDIKKNQPELSWNDVAILVRANDQAQTFIPYLERAGVPYQFLASSGLFSKSVILDLIAFLKLLDNYHESRAMYRVLTYDLWGIAAEDIMRISNFGTRKTQSIYDTCRSIRSVPALQPNTYAQVESILALVDRMTQLTHAKTAGEVVLTFLEESGYLQWMTKQETQRATENILYLNQFYKYIQAFERANSEKSVRYFVQELSLMIEAGDAGRLQPDFDEGPESVKIMTVHAAKGLEFEYVFIVNLVDKRFPSVGRKEAIAVPEALIRDVLPTGDWHVQEERRLFYVALTRAKSGLFLTSGEDYGGARKKKPSQFLVETGFVNTAPQPSGEVIFGKKAALQSTPAELRHLPKTFSFTQLKAYETCPWQYRFAFVLKVPVPGKPSFSFGKTIHNTLYEFFRRMKEASELKQGGLFDTQAEHEARTQAPTKKDLLEIYEQKWQDEWYYSQKQREEYRKKGRDALEKFYELHQYAWPRVLLLEKGFNVKLGQHTVKGAIDRVDTVLGGVEIVDYKTGAFPKDGKKDAEQLFLYALAMKEVFKEEPVKLTYYFIEDNKPLSIEMNPEKVQEVSEWAMGLIEKILSGDFTPTPGFHCSFCDYREICEYRSR